MFYQPLGNSSSFLYDAWMSTQNQRQQMLCSRQPAGHLGWKWELKAVLRQYLCRRFVWRQEHAAWEWICPITPPNDRERQLLLKASMPLEGRQWQIPAKGTMYSSNTEVDIMEYSECNSLLHLVMSLRHVRRSLPLQKVFFFFFFLFHQKGFYTKFEHKWIK